MLEGAPTSLSARGPSPRLRGRPGRRTNDRDAAYPDIQICSKYPNTRKQARPVVSPWTLDARPERALTSVWCIKHPARGASMGRGARTGPITEAPRSEESRESAERTVSGSTAPACHPRLRLHYSIRHLVVRTRASRRRPQVPARGLGLQPREEAPGLPRALQILTPPPRKEALPPAAFERPLSDPRPFLTTAGGRDHR